MSDVDPSTLNEQGFEQWLLDSAHSDPGPSGGGAQAWDEFAKTLEGIKHRAEGSSGALDSTRSSPKPSSSVDQTQFSSALRSKSLMWLLTGLLTGAGVTTAFMWPKVDSVKVHNQRIVITTPEAQLHREETLAPKPQKLPKQQQLSPSSSTNEDKQDVDRKTITTGQAHLDIRRKTSAGTSPTPLRLNSTLAEEVLQLDAVREALETQAPARALRLVSEYHRAYPRGVLAPEADILAIDSLLRLGDPKEANRRARLFLNSNPSHPQASRVRDLVQSQRR